MKANRMKITVKGTEYKCTSLNGNPSYWVYFEDSTGNFKKAYTASDASAGYSIQNYHNEVIDVDYHYTKKDKMVIDLIHNA